jgi:hypothetical protein
MDIRDEGRPVTVNVDARPSKASWLWKFAALALGLLLVLELAAIEKHLRLIADAQSMQAMGTMIPFAPPESKPEKSGYRLNAPNRIAER